MRRLSDAEFEKLDEIIISAIEDTVKLSDEIGMDRNGLVRYGASLYMSLAYMTDYANYKPDEEGEVTKEVLM